MGVGGGLEGLGAGGEGDVSELMSCMASSGKELRTGIVGVVNRCGGVGWECGSVFASEVGVRPDVLSILDKIEYSRFAVSEPKL